MINVTVLPENQQLRKFAEFRENEGAEVLEIRGTPKTNVKLLSQFLVNEKNYSDRDPEELRAFDYSLASHIVFADTLRKMAEQENAKKTSFSSFNPSSTSNFQPSTQTFGSGSIFGSNPQFNFSSTQSSWPSFSQPSSLLNQWSSIVSSSNTGLQLPGSLSTNWASQPSSFSLGQNKFGSDSIFAKSQSFPSFCPTSSTQSSQTFPSFGLNLNTTSTTSSGLGNWFNTITTTATAGVNQNTFQPQPQIQPCQISTSTSYPSHLGYYNQPLCVPQIHPYHFYPPPRYYPPYTDPWSSMRYPAMPPYNYGSYDPSLYLSREYDLVDPSKDNVNLQKMLMQRQSSAGLWHRYGIDPAVPISNSRPDLKYMETSDFKDYRHYSDNHPDKRRELNKDTVINVIPTLAGMKDGKQQIILSIEETPDNRSYIPKIFNPNSEISFTITSKENSLSRSYLANIPDDTPHENTIYEPSKLYDSFDQSRNAKDLPRPILSKTISTSRRKSILDMDLSDYATVPRIDSKISADVIGSEKKKVTFQDQIEMQQTVLKNSDESYVENNHPSKLNTTMDQSVNASMLYDKSVLDGSILKECQSGSAQFIRDSEAYKNSQKSQANTSNLLGGSMLFSGDETEPSLSISNSELVSKFKWTPSWLISKIKGSLSQSKDDLSIVKPRQKSLLTSSYSAPPDKLYLLKAPEKSPPLIEEITKQDKTSKKNSVQESSGVILKRSDYYTRPSLEELDKITKNGKCIVNNFTVGRHGVGKVLFVGEIDIFGLNLDKIIFIEPLEIEVYPDDDPSVVKPPVDSGLNRLAILTIYNIYPLDRDGKPIKDLYGNELAQYIEILRKKASSMDGVFVEYRPEEGLYSFMVSHFTKYGLKDDLNETFSEPCSNLSSIHSYVDKETAIEMLILKAYSEGELKKDDDIKNYIEILKKENIHLLPPSLGGTSSSLLITEKPKDQKRCTIKTSDETTEFKTQLRCLSLALTTCKHSKFFEMHNYFTDVFCLNLRCRHVYISTPLQLVFINFNSKPTIPLVKHDEVISELLCRSQSVNIRSLDNLIESPKSFNFLNLTSLEMLFNSLISCVKFTSSPSSDTPHCEHNDVGSFVRSHFTGDMMAQRPFRLIFSLWFNTPTKTIGNSDSDSVSRLKMFTKWVGLYCGEAARNESQVHLSNGNVFAAVLSLLSAQLVEEAVTLLNQTKNHRLAMLLTSSTDDQCLRSILAFQLDKWFNDQTDSYMDLDFIKICMIIAKLPFIAYDNNSILHICHGFDWVRSVGMLANFCSSPNHDPLREGFDLYLSHLDMFNEIITPPTPNYLVPSRSRNFKDICFYILELYCENHLNSLNMFEPSSYTKSQFDFSLSWHLYVILMPLIELDPITFLTISLNYSNHLEALGHWHLAIFVLSWTNDISIRKKYIYEILIRNIDHANDLQLHFVSLLNCSQRLVHSAKATVSRYRGNEMNEIQHLIAAEEYDQSHEVAIKHVFPKLLLNDDDDSLIELLSQYQLNLIKNSLYFNSNGMIYLYLTRLKKTQGSTNEDDIRSRIDYSAYIYKNICCMEVLNDYQLLARSKIIQICMESLIEHNLVYEVDWSGVIDFVDPDYVKMKWGHILRTVQP